MKNKLTLILCLLLVPAIAYPWAGQSIVDVLVQLIDSDVQVDSLGVGCAPSGTSGEVAALRYMPQTGSNLPVVAQLNSGSVSSSIFEIVDSSGSTLFTFDTAGLAQIPNIYGAGGGPLKLQGYTGSTYGVVDFLRIGDSQLNLDLSIPPTGALKVKDSSTTNDRFGFSQSGSGADIDAVQTFYGGTNTGVLKWDDSASTFDFSDPVEIAPVASTPTAPTTGVILFSDSEDYSNLKVVFPSGNVVTVATDPSP